MPDPNVILPYVEPPARGVSFYARILGRDSVEFSTTFMLFKLDSGGMLGLWGRLGVEPSAANPGVGNWLLP